MRQPPQRQTMRPFCSARANLQQIGHSTPSSCEPAPEGRTRAPTEHVHVGVWCVRPQVKARGRGFKKRSGSAPHCCSHASAISAAWLSASRCSASNRSSCASRAASAGPRQRAEQTNQGVGKRPRAPSRSESLRQIGGRRRARDFAIAAQSAEARCGWRACEGELLFDEALQAVEKIFPLDVGEAAQSVLLRAGEEADMNAVRCRRGRRERDAGREGGGRGERAGRAQASRMPVSSGVPGAETEAARGEREAGVRA